MKMSPLTKSLSIHLVAIRLSFILLLQVNAHALDTTSSLGLINTVNVASNKTDFHALLAFKSNILKDYQLALSSWNDSRHFCHWQGVQCGRRHERVTAISLPSSGLTGSLSPYVGNLSFLRELSLFNNTLTGVIPSELGNLFRLQKLFLDNNSFEGQIPPSLSRCSNLRELWVSNNKLVGELPKELASSMPRLSLIAIHKNNLSGGIPLWIGNLTSLEEFSAAYNPLGGRIPNALGQLRNLNFLGVAGAQISEYGLGSEMSSSGDIYSYGILLLEMITSKRPTDKMFEGDLNLHNFARIALPQRVMEIVDPMLLTEDTYGNKMMESLISLVKIGLACSIESPNDRMDINTALHELHVVKKNLLKVLENMGEILKASGANYSSVVKTVYAD